MIIIIGSIILYMCANNFSACLQNINHFEQMDQWTHYIPQNVDDLRSRAIEFMRNNRDKFVCGRVINNRYEDPPMTSEMFDELIRTQSRPNEWTDQDGWFVTSVAQMLDVEILVFFPDISSDVLDSGLGGPVQIINRDYNGNGRLRFSMALTRLDNNNTGGHYQHIIYDESVLAENVASSASNTQPVAPAPALTRQQSSVGLLL